MKQVRRVPSRGDAMHSGNQVFAGISKSGGFNCKDKAKRLHLARPWRARIGLRQRCNPNRLEYFVSISNSITFVGLWGRVVAGNHPHVNLEGELRAVLTALTWLQHEHQTLCEIKLSATCFEVFLRTLPCPHQLQPLLDEVHRAYLANKSLRVSRERRALVSRNEERREAA